MDVPRTLVGILAVAAAAATPVRSAAQSTRTIPVRLTEFRIEMPDSVQQGRVVLAVTNAGTVAHSLRVRGHRGQVATRTLAPGESVDVPIRLIVGEYVAWCGEKTGDLEHRKEGMEHRVRVIW